MPRRKIFVRSNDQQCFYPIVVLEILVLVYIFKILANGILKNLNYSIDMY